VRIGYIHEPLKTSWSHIRFLFSAMMCCALAVKSQKPELGFGTYRLISTDDGLPSNNVTCFVQDKKGFIWLGTSEGLARFDGSAIRVFQHDPNDSTSLSSNKIKRMALDSAGYLWVGTADQGLNKFDTETYIFTSYRFNPYDTTSIGNNNIHALTVDPNGTLWVGQNGNGISMYRPDSDDFLRIVPPYLNISYRDRQTKIINDIIPDINDPDIFWFTTYDGLWKYHLSTGTWNLFDDLSQFRIQNEEVNRSFRHGSQGKDGKIYIAAFRRGVFCFDPEREQWEHFTERSFDPKILHHNNFQLVQQRDENSFWIGSNTRGICILDLNTGYVELLGSCEKNNPDDLCNIFVNAMKLDDNGTHWIATNKGFRIYHNRNNRMNSVATEAIAPHLEGRFHIRSIYPLNNTTLYYGGYAGDGVYKFNLDTRTTTIISPPKGHRPNELREMFWVEQFLPFREGKLLLLSAYQLFTLDTLTEQISLVKSNIDDGRSLQFYNHIALHSNGKYYLSSRHNGVFVLDSTLQVVDELVHDPKNPNSLVSSNYVFSSCEDPDGKLWIGTEEGFSVYDPLSGDFDNFDYRTRADSVPMLKGVYSILLHPDSSLWFIDSNSSIAILEYPYTKPYVFRVINSSDGLANDKVNNVLFDSNGNAWISNKDAVSYMNTRGEIQNFTPKHSVPLMRARAPMQFMKNGHIVIGAEKKLVWFDPEALKDAQIQAPLYIASIKIYGQEYDPKMRYADLENIELDYKENFFSIDLGMINFSHVGELVTWYRLKGFSDDWTRVGNEMRAIFTNVPGGSYTFEVKTTDVNMHQLPDTLSLGIRIIPPFWKTWWFAPLLILLALVLFFSFYALRINAVRREARLTTAFNKRLANVELSALRAQMNPHFLFNSLNSIRHQIITNSVEKADEYLVKFSRLVRLVLQNSRSQLIPLGDELEALRLYIDLESGRFDGKFSSKISISPELDAENLVIPPMIIQPFVENAIWHGLMQKDAPGKVEITVTPEDGRLKIVIEDDGIGREKARILKSKSALQQESMGMDITGNRLEIIEKIYNIRCKVEIEDLENDARQPLGTRITINLPLKNGHQGSYS
jgi:ligand-binding sensor domain-containing protein